MAKHNRRWCIKELAVIRYGKEAWYSKQLPKFSQIGITLCRYSQIADPHTDLRNQRKEVGVKQYEHLRTSWQKFP